MRPMNIARGDRFGCWVIVKGDATGKRFVVACVCGTVRHVGHEALEDGSSQGCGCRMTRVGRVDPKPSSPSVFARDLAAIEMPPGIRINAVSPTVVEESMKDFGPFFRGHDPVPALRVGRAFSRSSEGLETGKTYRVV